MKRLPRLRGRKPKEFRRTNSPSANLHHFENALYSNGIRLIAGIDEAGRGPLAGPVVAAAVILPRDCHLEGLRDSKKLTPKRRDHFYDEIFKVALAYGVGVIEPDEIDSINILRASLKAMKIAVEGLKVLPEYLLIDGMQRIDHYIPQFPIKGGDDRSHSIAAASVIAKVTRDRMMCEMERRYPGFSFSKHKGYGTKMHYEEIAKYGPLAIHRRTFLKNIFF